MRPDNTPRGPARWERAALNAVRRPNSAAARLYQQRLLNAYRIASTADSDGPFTFYQRDYNYQTRVTTWRRRYSTCSRFCTAMQVQLDFNVLTLAGIAEALKERPGAHTRVCHFIPTPRPVRCQYCGGRVRS